MERKLPLMQFAAVSYKSIFCFFHNLAVATNAPYARIRGKDYCIDYAKALVRMGEATLEETQVYVRFQLQSEELKESLFGALAKKKN